MKKNRKKENFAPYQQICYVDNKLIVILFYQA